MSTLSNKVYHAAVASNDWTDRNALLAASQNVGKAEKALSASTGSSPAVKSKRAAALKAARIDLANLEASLSEKYL